MYRAQSSIIIAGNDIKNHATENKSDASFLLTTGLTDSTRDQLESSNVYIFDTNIDSIRRTY